jgi:hypothetical protein
MSGIDNIPAETRWAVATQALTGANTATGAAFEQAVGEQGYKQAVTAIWREAGKSSGEVAEAVGLPRPTDAPGLWEAMETLVHLIMGPEFVSEVTESSPDRVVVRVSSCPWAKRFSEQGVTSSPCVEGHNAWAGGVAGYFGLALRHELPTVMPRGAAGGAHRVERHDNQFVGGAT